METRSRPRPRPEVRITRDVIPFDLVGQARTLRDEKPWADHGHDAMTLFRRDHSRAVLIVLKAGMKIPQHETPASVTLQPVEGRVRVHLRGEIIELGPHTLLSLESHVRYDIEARSQDVTLLLTFSPCGRAS